MDLDEARELLRTQHRAVLATWRRDGTPQLSPVTVGVDEDGYAVISSRQTAFKVRNLRRDPRCSLLVESGRKYEDLKGVLIRGRATLEPDTERVLDLLERVHEKYNRGPAAGLRDAMRHQAAKRVLIRVRPERVSSWDHGKLGGAY